MKSLIFFVPFLLVTVTKSATLVDRFIPPFLSTGTSEHSTIDSAAGIVNASEVSASPVIVTQGGQGGKKVRITITKEITKHEGMHDGMHHEGMHDGVHHEGMHDGSAHAAHEGHDHTATHEHANAHQGTAHLHIDNNQLLIDNETMAGLLQHILAGNVQNVQAHGQPLDIPAGGKPVAVIFSSAMHVVDLGTLQAPHLAPAHVHAEHAAHVHPNHNATHQGNHTMDHQHQHAGLNHSSLLESLISPLMSLTHLHGGASHHTAHAASTQQFVQTPVMQPMQMQPIVFMMPVPAAAGVQTFASQTPVQVEASSAAQLGGVLQGLLSAKQQILSGSLGHNHQAGEHADHHSEHVGHQSDHSIQEVQSIQSSAQEVQSPALPVVVAQQEPKKLKTVNISISKTKA